MYFFCVREKDDLVALNGFMTRGEMYSVDHRELETESVSLECVVDKEQRLTWTFINDEDQETVIAVDDRLQSTESSSKYGVWRGTASSLLTVSRVRVGEEGRYRCYRGDTHHHYITHTLEISGWLPLLQTEPTTYRVQEGDTAR